MSVTDRNVIDIISLENDNLCKTLVMFISDHLAWNNDVRTIHLSILQDKINDYLDFITSKQIDQYYTNDQYDHITIRILFSFPVPHDGILFLRKAKTIIQDAGYDLEWKYDP